MLVQVDPGGIAALHLALYVSNGYRYMNWFNMKSGTGVFYMNCFKLIQVVCTHKLIYRHSPFAIQFR